MTNAQAAMIAATSGVSWDTKQAIRRAEEFKAWLDAQDAKPYSETLEEILRAKAKSVISEELHGISRSS